MNNKHFFKEYPPVQVPVSQNKKDFMKRVIKRKASMCIWPTKISLYEYNVYAMYIVLFNAPFSLYRGYRVPVPVLIKFIVPVGLNKKHVR